MNVFSKCKGIIEDYMSMTTIGDRVDITVTEDYVQLVTVDPEESTTDITIYKDGTCAFDWSTGRSIPDYMGVKRGDVVNPKDLEYALSVLLSWECE